ncbi:MAG: hypothetical protein K2Z81_08140, partial [Cyanobacteria bacterium]|nr:hypothetical protein [Cyanobacteriota bacterium]
MVTETKEKQIVIKAINDLGRRVTASDVATKTGLPILKVTSELNRIASETDGNMEVAGTGTIAYKFSSGFQTKYLTTGFKRVWDIFWGKTFAVAFFLFRISFGIMLILSLIMVAILIIAVIIYFSSRNNDDRDGGFGGGFGGHGGFHFGFFDYLILRDLLFWGSYGGGRSTTYRYDRPTIRTPEKGGNFLFNCFSFLFGDGNPNLNLEDRKWKMIAEVIRASSGVVTAEQLAPYTGEDPDNEDGVLPALVRFDGRPEVTDEGDIVYVFPSMQETTIASKGFSLPPYLEEWKLKFTNVPDGQMTMVYVLAGVYFLGSWFLFLQMVTGHVPILTALWPIVTFLTAYGTFFVTVPVVRHFINKFINGRIESRNAKRRANANLLSDPSDKLLKKLAHAASYKTSAKVLTSNDIIFTSER